ncbi:hypothetical protein ACFV9C_42135 [Kribbella sp. NPDC059898]|uniref:hypothetical protein n=1 Tax=Kribbella sp. NPDC059898 TaxID=3346995 RepID=UPI003663106C
MPELRTDDGPRRLRAVWLGPKGLRWPADWTYVQWGVFLSLGLIMTVLLVLVLIPASGWLAAMGGPTWGFALAYLITPRVMKHIDYDRPLRWYRRHLMSEWKNSSTHVDAEQRDQLMAPVPTSFAPRVEAELFPQGRGPVTPIPRDWKEIN